MQALFIVLTALGLMLGIYSRQTALRRVGRILALAAVSPILLSMGRGYFGQMTPVQQLVTLLLLFIAGGYLVTRLFVGKQRANEMTGSAILSVGKYLFVAPFRMISAFFKKYA